MKSFAGRHKFLIAIGSALALLTAGCDSNVSGGATLSPVSESYGGATLAVSTDVTATSVRSAGFFRNSDAGVSFAFRVKDSSFGPIPSGLRAAVSRQTQRMTNPGCAIFGGVYSKGVGLDSREGGVIGIVIADNSGQNLVVLGAGASVLSEPSYLYAGLVSKGNFRIARSELGECS